MVKGGGVCAGPYTLTRSGKVYPSRSPCNSLCGCKMMAWTSFSRASSLSTWKHRNCPPLRGGNSFAYGTMCKIRAIDSAYRLAERLFHEFQNNKRWIGFCVRWPNLVKSDAEPMFNCRVNDTFLEVRPIIKTSVMLPIALRSDD